MIYFIQAGGSRGPIKIGVADDPKQRLRQLQTASPQPLRLLGTIEGRYNAEKVLHKQFEALRLQGEWFHPGADLRDFILIKNRKAAGRRRRHEIVAARKAQVEGCVCDIIDIYDGTFCHVCWQRKHDEERRARMTA